jgi:hypothetical protein
VTAGRVVALVLFLVLLAWFSLRRGTVLRSPLWLLFRSLFPAFGFFESVGDVPRLTYRTATNEGPLGPWLPAPEPATRGFGALLLNAQGNLHLAQQGLIERLISDLELTSDEPSSESVAYLLVQRLVRSWISQRAQGSAPLLAATRYQFRVITGSDEEVLVSLVHSL